MAIAEADCVVVIGDGRDGDLPYSEASHLDSPERIAQLETGWNPRRGSYFDADEASSGAITQRNPLKL